MDLCTKSLGLSARFGSGKHRAFRYYILMDNGRQLLPDLYHMPRNSVTANR